MVVINSDQLTIANYRAMSQHSTAALIAKRIHVIFTDSRSHN